MHLWVILIRWLTGVLAAAPETNVSGSLGTNVSGSLETNVSGSLGTDVSGSPSCRPKRKATVWTYRDSGRQMFWRPDIFHAGRVTVCRWLETYGVPPGLCAAAVPCCVAAGVAGAGWPAPAAIVPHRRRTRNSSLQ